MPGYTRADWFLSLAGSMQLKVGQASRLPSQPWGISLNKRFRTSSLRGEAGRRYELFARTAVRAGQARRLPYLGLHRSIELDASFEIGDWELGAFGWAFSLRKLRCARRSGAHETATAGPRTVPVRSSIALFNWVFGFRASLDLRRSGFVIFHRLLGKSLVSEAEPTMLWRDEDPETSPTATR